MAGQVRGLSLGLIRDGRFHPYERGTTGTCAHADHPLMYDRLTIGGRRPRTIVFGRTRDTDRYVVVPSGGKSRSVRPARGGAFLFVFDGSLLPDEGIPRLGPKIQP